MLRWTAHAPSLALKPGCGNARPERDLPTASVSYISARCGFLMAAQTVAEALDSEKNAGLAARPPVVLG